MLRLQIVYHLLSLQDNARVRVKSCVDEALKQCTSVASPFHSGVWRALHILSMLTACDCTADTAAAQGSGKQSHPLQMFGCYLVGCLAISGLQEIGQCAVAGVLASILRTQGKQTLL